MVCIHANPTFVTEWLERARSASGDANKRATALRTICDTDRRPGRPPRRQFPCSSAATQMGRAARFAMASEEWSVASGTAGFPDEREPWVGEGLGAGVAAARARKRHAGGSVLRWSGEPAVGDLVPGLQRVLRSRGATTARAGPLSPK